MAEPHSKHLGHAMGSCFDFDKSFATYYLGGNRRESGNLLYRFGDHGWCWLVYWSMPLAIDQARIGEAAQLQAFTQAGCSPDEIEAALEDFKRRMTDAGFRAVLHLSLIHI